MFVKNIIITNISHHDVVVHLNHCFYFELCCFNQEMLGHANQLIITNKLKIKGDFTVYKLNEYIIITMYFKNDLIKYITDNSCVKSNMK